MLGFRQTRVKRYRRASTGTGPREAKRQHHETLLKHSRPESSKSRSATLAESSRLRVPASKCGEDHQTEITRSDGVTYLISKQFDKRNSFYQCSKGDLSHLNLFLPVLETSLKGKCSLCKTFGSPHQKLARGKNQDEVATWQTRIRGRLHLPRLDLQSLKQWRDWFLHSTLGQRPAIQLDARECFSGEEVVLWRP